MSVDEIGPTPLGAAYRLQRDGDGFAVHRVLTTVFARFETRDEAVAYMVATKEARQRADNDPAFEERRRDEQMMVLLRASFKVRDGSWICGAPTHVLAEVLTELERDGWRLVQDEQRQK